MEIKKVTNNMYAIRLEVGEEIIGSIKNFVIENKIGFAKISAIGAVENTKLGYLKGTDYIDTTFEADMELVSLMGSVSWVEGTPFVHAHAMLSDDKCISYGGHMHHSTVSATCEIFIEVFDMHVERKYNEAARIKVWDLSK